jgi:hypothetical protein
MTIGFCVSAFSGGYSNATVYAANGRGIQMTLEEEDHLDSRLEADQSSDSPVEANQVLDENRVIDFVLQSDFLEISAICTRLRKAAPPRTGGTPKSAKPISAAAQRLINDATRQVLEFQAQYQNKALSPCFDTPSS